MTRIVGAGIVMVSLLLAACGPGEDQAGDPADPATVYSASGTIIAVAGDSVTIDHAPIAELGWPAMTMMFAVGDAALTQNLRTGAPVAFSFRRDGNVNILTEIEPRN